jgi:hypothetical protein
MATLIAVIMSIIIFFYSYLMVQRQRKANNTSRVKDPSGPQTSATVSPNTSVQNLVKQPHSTAHPLLVEASFTDLQFRVDGDGSGADIIRHQYRDILPGISGQIPAGKFSVILGPTAW